MSPEAAKKLGLAKKHLRKVQRAWDPVDWSDLTIYGVYALETAIQGAAEEKSIAWDKTHPSMVRTAAELHRLHGLPNIVPLLKDLQRSRLYTAYGDIRPSGQYDPEDIATEVEQYVDAVKALLS